MPNSPPRGRGHLYLVPDPAPDPTDPHTLRPLNWRPDRQVQVPCSCTWTRCYPSTQHAHAGHDQHRAELRR